ncbi:MAG: acyl carrier protein [Kofleriaceae bacterium]
MSEAEAKLRAAFSESLGLPADTQYESLTYRGIKQWDSVAHMQLVAAIEAAFDLMLETEDVIGMSSYGKAQEIVRKHGVAL